MKPTIPPTGPSNAKLLIVGEADGEMEEARNEHLVGPTGMMVQNDVKVAGMDWSTVLRTNVAPWHPPGNDLRRLPEIGHTLEEGQELLKALIINTRPNCILGLGDIALRTLTGMTKMDNWRGSILRYKYNTDIKVVTTRHPAWLFKQNPLTGKKTPYWWRNVIQFDIARAVNESKYSTVDLPLRTISIISNTNQLHNFILGARRRPRKNGRIEIALDIEAHRTLPDCVGLADSPNNCIVIPLFNIPYAIGFPKIEPREHAFMIKMLAEFLEDSGTGVGGQNIRYDAWRLKQVTGINIFPNLIWDIMIRFHVCYPELPKKLGFITSILTREPFYKDEGKEFDFSRHNIQQRYIYNGKDCCTTFEANVNLESEVAELGMTEFADKYLLGLLPYYLEQEQNGFKGDHKKRNELLLKYELSRVNSESELFSLAGGSVNIRSTAHEVPGKRKEGQLPRLLKSFGFPDRASYDENSLTALYAFHAKTDIQKRVIDLVLNLRGTYALIKKLAEKPDWDGNYRCIVNPFATETGRSSTQKLGFKNPYRLEDLAWAQHSMTKRGIGYDLRTVLTCDEDELIVEFDYSQAEPRVVANLSDDYDLLEMFRLGTIDIHKWTAKLAMQFTKPWQEVNSGERFIGKTCRNAGNLGVGYGRFTASVNTDAKKYGILGPDGFPIKISESEGNKCLQGFHRFSPRVRAIFHAGTIEALNMNDYVLVNPYGRKRRFMGRKNDDTTHKEAFAFMASSPVSDHLKHAIGSIGNRRSVQKWEHVKLVLDYHDALVFRMPIARVGDYGPQIKEIMETKMDFSKCSLPRRELLIPIEVKAGSNYGEMKEIKF